MNSQHVYLPAEWHPQDAILITWPHQESAWFSMLERVEQTYLDLTCQISRYQNVVIQLHSSIDAKVLLGKLQLENANLSRLHFVRCDSNDTWARDHGPITILENERPICLDFKFNGWGNKFESELDNRLNLILSNKEVLRQSVRFDWVLEGGSIESDGKGTLMTTSACVLNSNRNGICSKDELTTSFQKWFGCEQVVWLDHGELEGDDTDAHIDTLARFAPNNTIVYQGCQNADDSHFNALELMASQLKEATNTDGDHYHLLELPFPSPKYAEDGHRLPATYANFLICNDQVIVPTYQDEADAKALGVIEQAFPDHIVHGVDALSLIEEHGSIHCITMQLPKGSVNFEAAFEADLLISG